MSDKPTGAGRSSFDLIDRKLFLDAIESFQPKAVLDLGCGAGNYSLALARHLGPDREVYGVDLWEEGIRQLGDRAEAETWPICGPWWAMPTAGFPCRTGRWI